MSNLDIPSGSPFDAIKRVDDDGEYWSARELMPLLGYRKWDKFEDSIERARVSIETTGLDPESHASRRREAFGRTRQSGANYRLTRHGAYVTAMNGDVRKPEIAAAQAYFAAKTREAEAAQMAAALPEPSRKELAQYWYEAEQRAEVEAARAVKAENRARAIEGKFREFEGGDGITLTKFHKKHFSEVGERTFFEHLYSRHYLIDQRSKGSEREDGTRRDGPEHAHPGAKGKQFLYLHEGGVHGGRRRHRTYVRPGDPELLFKAALVRDGLRGNQHVVGQLFAIEGGAS